MKKYLFFDSETTGLPVNFDAPTSDTKNWPHLVQLSWIVTDQFGNELKAENHIIKPCRWKIPEKATRVHGITQEHAKKVGKPIKEVMELFMSDFDEAELIIGHNIGFDKSIVGCELVRLHQEDRVADKKEFDTMLGTINFCQIGWNDYYGTYKWPKLQELYTKLFGHEFDSAHDASNDTRATMECFWELIRQGIVQIP